MYGHIATATGWTLGEIDLLSLWEVNELFDYWQQHPPVHVMVAAYLLGGKTPSPRNRSFHENATFAELAQTVQTAGGSVNLKLPKIYAKVKS